VFDRCLDIAGDYGRVQDMFGWDPSVRHCSATLPIAML